MWAVKKIYLLIIAILISLEDVFCQKHDGPRNYISYNMTDELVWSPME